MPVTLDSLAPVFALGLDPSLPMKPYSLAPVISLRLSLTYLASHSTAFVLLPWGLTPDPLGPAITAPATLGPAQSATLKSGLVATPTELAPLGPDQRLAAAQFPGTIPPGVAVPTPSKTTDPLLAQATSTTEQIKQAVFLLI